jgi:hypothetical protein
MDKISFKDAITLTQEVVERNGYELIAVKPISAHLEDSYLTVVLCDRHTEHQPFVTWICNLSCQGLGTGYYFDNLKDALKKFNERD